ncbi:S8 family serine peptidase [Baaleninema sp.]|uniref:S8 family serine peptidase n=1 Tax=Baaleninema sp. TaxID=3101197 RepID=UPI003CFE4280
MLDYSSPEETYRPELKSGSIAQPDPNYPGNLAGLQKQTPLEPHESGGLDTPELPEIPIIEIPESDIDDPGTDRRFEEGFGDENSNSEFDVGYSKSDPITGDYNTYDETEGSGVGIPDPNDFSQAIDLDVLDELTHVTGDIDFTNPNDLYRFQLTAEQLVSLYLYGLEGDADLFLMHDRNENQEFDEGELIDYSFRYGSFAESIERSLEAGTYYLRVAYYRGDTDYHLQLNATDLAGDDIAGNRLDTALDLGKLDSPRTVREFVGNSDAEDYYRIQLDRDRNIGLRVGNLTADVDVEIITEDGTVVAGSYNWDNSDEQFDCALAAGTYFVRVAQYEGSTHYDLSLSDIPLDPAGNDFDSALNVGILNSSTYYSGIVNNLDVYDYYRFDLTQTTDVRLGLQPFHGNPNLELIRDANGDGIFENSESISASINWGTAEEVVEMTLEAGTYYARVVDDLYSFNHFWCFEERPPSDYTLHLEATAFDRPGDRPETARNLGTTPDGILYEGFIGHGNERDVYRFEVDETTDFDFAVREVNTAMRVSLTWDSNGDGAIDELDESRSRSCYEADSIALEQVLEAGTYYLTVESEGGNSDYILSSFATPVTESDLAGNTLVEAADLGVLSDPIAIADNVGVADGDDWYRFHLDREGEVEMWLYDLDEDVDIELSRDRNGNGAIEPEEIRSGSYRSSGVESIRESLEAGTYAVRVLSFDGEDSDYQLLLTRRDRVSAVEAGNSLETSADLGLLEETVTLQPSNSNDGEGDYYRFEVDTYSQFNIFASRSDDFTTVCLLGEDGETILTRSGFKVVSCDRYLEPGTYFLRVDSSKPNPDSDSLLVLSAEPIEQNDSVGNTLTTALGMGNLGESWQVLNEQVGGFDSSDIYRFTVEGDRNFSALWDATNGGGSLQLIRDENHNGVIDEGEILTNSRYYDSGKSIDRLLSEGTYFIQVGGGSQISDYRLNLRTTAAIVPELVEFPELAIELPPDEAGNTPETARDLAQLGEFISVSDGVSSLNDPDDYYSFEVTENGELTLLVSDFSQELTLELSDGEETRVFSIDDWNYFSWRNFQGRNFQGRNFQEIDEFLRAGSYTLCVTVPEDTPATPYRLSFSFEAIADTAGDTMATARDLGSLDSAVLLEEFIGNFDAADAYRFDVTGNHPVSIAFEGLADYADVELGRDGNGNGAIDEDEILELTDEIDYRGLEWQFDNLEAGTYVVQVRHVEDRSWYSNHYQISLRPDSYSIKTGYGQVKANAALGLSPSEDNASGKNLWGIDRVEAPEAWNHGYRGDGVVVAVVDTGVDWHHEDLADNIWTNADEIADNGIDDDGNGFIDDVRGWDFVNEDNDPLDLHGHGTHVSGTIAALDNGFGVTGVAPHATIMPVQVLNAGGSGTYRDVADGVRYAAANGADVINLSLGGGYSSDLEVAIRSAVAQGVVVVMSAGNSGASSPGYPAQGAIDRGMAVGAYDSDRQMAWFSNCAGFNCDYVMAPGVDVYSTLPNHRYGSYSGTSMAAPHVSGVAALVRQANPNATVEEIETAIVRSGDRHAVMD